MSRLHNMQLLLLDSVTIINFCARFIPFIPPAYSNKVSRLVT